MTRVRIPDDVLSAAHARATARRAQDWAEADRLRAEIETAGWQVVDRGTDFALSPATQPDQVDGEQIRFGASGNVPSRLGEAPVGLATIILVATDWPMDLTRALAGLRRHAPPGTSVVVVADDPSDDQVVSLGESSLSPDDPLPIEVVWTSQRLGHAASLNIGVRRAGSPVIVVLDSGTELTGDIVTPLVRALDDPSVGVTGGWGLVSSDVRAFSEAPAGEVDAITGDALAFRRSDFPSRGPMDERFRADPLLDVWWSLRLRDEGEGNPSRRALAVDGVPAIRHGRRGPAAAPDGDRDRQAKRNFYRVFDAYGNRSDLLIAGG